MRMSMPHCPPLVQAEALIDNQKKKYWENIRLTAFLITTHQFINLYHKKSISKEFGCDYVLV